MRARFLQGKLLQIVLIWVIFFSFTFFFGGCAKQGEQATQPGTPKGQPPATQTVTQSGSSTIKVGAYFSLTGDIATFGQSSVNAIRLAVDEINKTGGILDKKLDLIIEDTQSKQDGAASAVQKLISQDNVDVILGEVASSNSLSAAPICQKSQVPMITPSSTNPAVTQTGDYIFRVCFIDPFQGYVMAKFASEKLKLKKAAMLVDKSCDYCKGLAQYFKDTFTKVGGEIITEEAYFQKDTDFKGQLTNIKGKKPQLLFIPGYYTEVGLIAKQARQLGINVPLLGGDGWDSPKLLEIGGKDIEGGYFSNHYSVEANTPKIKAFVEAYEKKYGSVPDSLAALAYDAVYVMADAYKRAGAIEKKALRDALAQTKDFDGVTGRITINNERNADKSAVVLQIKGGKYTYLTTIEPAKVQ